MNENKRYVIIIRSDGEVAKKLWLPEMGLLELQELVGGYIETAPADSEDFVLIVNEEGKNEDLPRNKKATRILPKFIQKKDYIVGTAVLMKRGREDVEPMTAAEAALWMSKIG